MTTYFTGRPCKYGHVSKRYKSNNRCCECMREADRVRRKASRDRDIKYREANRQKLRDAAQQYRLRNPQKIKISQQKSKAKKPQFYVDRRREYHERNKDRRLTYGKFRRQRMVVRVTRAVESTSNTCN